MSATISKATVGAHRALIIENDQVRLTTLPELGGRIWELVDRVRDVQWIWHRPAVPLVASSPGAEYDAVWAGGWEELFPNDASCEFEGRDLPDHGEWWTRNWDVDASSSGAEAVVRLSCRMSAIRARCTKEIRLASDGAAVDVRYRIESEEAAPFHFLFKQHLPVRISPSSRLVVPGGSVTAVDPAFGSLMPDAGPHPWPVARDEGGIGTDLAHVLPAESRAREFVYLQGLPATWCGVDDSETRASLRLEWEMEHLPYLWLFISYGGWRDAYTVVLEPCTNLPKDLHEAVRRGQSPRLDPGGVFETRVRVTLSGLGDSDA
jgi:hypothetical protein